MDEVVISAVSPDVAGRRCTRIALAGREDFYKRFGHVRCQDGPFGAGPRHRRRRIDADQALVNT